MINREIHLEDEQKEILEQEDPIENLAEDKPAKVDPLGLLPWGAFRQLEIPTPTEYWGDKFIFERGRVLLLGKPKIGKSHWIGAFATAASTGSKFMGKEFPRPMKVMWLQAEIIDAYIRDRVELYLKSYEQHSEMIELIDQNLVVTGRLQKNLMRDADIDMVARSIEFHEPDMIMIDPVINFFSGEENKNEDVQKFLSRVDKLIDTYRVTAILAHHTGKERQDDMSFMSARGGSAFAGWFDSGVKLLGEKPNVTLFYEARNAREPESHAAYFNFDTGFWNIVDLGPAELEPYQIADIVASAMNPVKFYTRTQIELLARETLKKAGQSSGQKAGRKAIKHVRDLKTKTVLTRRQGAIVWHFLSGNEAVPPWKINKAAPF